MKKAQNWFLILLFLGAVFGFAGVTLVQKSRDFSERENRALAQLPDVNLEEILSGEFEQDYETYLSDQFVGRDAWIGLKTDVERLMGKQEIKDVYFAEDDYLIESHAGTFETAQAQTNIQLLASFLEKYREQFLGNRMTVLVAPNAVEVLDYKLPLYAPDSGEADYLEQIRSAVPEGTWFDAEAVLKSHLNEQLYYRTDHHWTTLAAFYTYREWAEEKGFGTVSLADYERETLTTEFLGTIESKIGQAEVPDTIERFEREDEGGYTLQYNQVKETSQDLYHMEMLETKDKYAVFYGGNQALIQAKTEVKNGRKLLVIKDSYANCFVPFTYRDFEQVDMVDIRYFNSSLEELIAEEGYTDLLFLYNASGFAEDTSLMKLMN